MIFLQYFPAMNNTYEMANLVPIHPDGVLVIYLSTVGTLKLNIYKLQYIFKHPANTQMLKSFAAMIF